VTKRDDNRVTKLPQIPFIETEINGIRNGQLIHPTTNAATLGKVYSNGCIGTNEADAWVIYYYAPIETKIKIRYDLNVVDASGDSIVLKDIYNKKQK
jgi:L,D-transpeptidase ErfK/SrfK